MVYTMVYQDELLEQRRQAKGLVNATLDSMIKRINKLHYHVRSQTDHPKWY
jgi:hypothetical protein